MIETLAGLGSALVPVYWMPVLTWTAIASVAGLAMRVASKRLNPGLTLAASVALLLSLPIGFAAGHFGAGLIDLNLDAPRQPLSATTTDYLSFQSAPQESANPVEPVTPSVSDRRTTVAHGSRTGRSFAASSVGASRTERLVLVAVGFASLVVLARIVWIAVRLVVQLLSVRRIRRGLVKIDDPGLLRRLRELQNRLGITRRIAFASSERLPPMTFGFIRPTVVVPSELFADDVAFRSAVEHELLHVRGHDYLARLAAHVLLLPFAWHPLVAWLSGKAMDAREAMCDRLVLRRGAVTMRQYAGTLVRFAGYPSPQALGPSFAVTQSKLRRRLSVMKNSRYDSLGGRGPIVLGATLLLLSAGATACSGPADEASVAPEERVAMLDREVEYLVNEFRLATEESRPLAEQMSIPSRRDSMTTEQRIQFDVVGARRTLLREMLNDKLREREVARLQLATLQE